MLSFEDEGRIKQEADLIIRIAKKELMTEKQGEPSKQQLYDIIIALWDLLDNIDTISEFHINDTDIVRRLMDITQERHKFVKSDGYDLFIEDCRITNRKDSL